MNHITNISVTAMWTHVGKFSLHGDGYRLIAPNEIPRSPGVYQIIAPDAPHNFNNIYVGEGRNLWRRLANYQNAGYRPDRRAATNRRIQGWIYDGISLHNLNFEIHICTKGEVTTQEAATLELDFSLKHTRVLVENLTRSSQPQLRFENL